MFSKIDISVKLNMFRKIDISVELNMFSRIECLVKSIMFSSYAKWIFSGEQSSPGRSAHLKQQHNNYKLKGQYPAL